MDKSKLLTDKLFINFLTCQVKGIFNFKFDCNHIQHDSLDFPTPQDSNGCYECTQELINKSSFENYFERLYQWFKQIETHQYNHEYSHEYYFHPIDMIKCFQTIGNYLTPKQGSYFCSPWLDGMLSIINLNNIKIIKVHVIFRTLCAQGYLETLQWLYKCEENNLTFSINQQIQIFTNICENGQFRVLKFILNLEGNNKFNKNIDKKDGFILAGENGHFEVIQLLLNLEDNQKINNIAIGHVFLKACEYGYIRIVKLLLELEGDQRINIHRTIFMEKKGTRNEPYFYYSTVFYHANLAFIEACKYSNIDIVKLLLSLEGDRQILISDNESAFIEACEFGCIEIVKLLLALKGDRKINIHINNYYALRLACLNNRFEVVELLLKVDDDRKLDNDTICYIVNILNDYCTKDYIKIIKLLQSYMFTE